MQKGDAPPSLLFRRKNQSPAELDPSHDFGAGIVDGVWSSLMWPSAGAPARLRFDGQATDVARWTNSLPRRTDGCNMARHLAARRRQPDGQRAGCPWSGIG